jgi:hypothetical protein
MVLVSLEVIRRGLSDPVERVIAGMRRLTVDAGFATSPSDRDRRVVNSGIR